MLAGLWDVRARWLLLAVAAVVLVVHSLVYNFVTDDAYISFVYSRNFAEHGELAFNLGDPVEGYTNFSWTVLLGALMVIGIPPELSSRVLGTACALITLLLVARLIERALGRRTSWSAVPALLLASSSGYACWSSGGLETQLFTVLVTGALDAVVAAVDRPRAIRRAGALLALAAMTRPEGVLVAAVLGAVWVVHRVVARRPGVRDELFAAAWFLALWLPWFAWRCWYYGWLFPNTYYVKASGSWIDAGSPTAHLARDMQSHGAYYVWRWIEQTHVLYALPLVALGLWSARRPRTPRFALGLACAVLAAVYLPYTISVGGDFMGLHRFVMPMFVVAALLVVLGLEELVRLVPARWLPDARRPIAAIAAAVVVAGGFAYSQLQLTRQSLRPRNYMPDRGIDTPRFLIDYTEDRAAIGRAMEPCFRPDDFSIVGGAGAQPYHARMRGIDVFGLVSDRIAHEEPRIRARPGHTKWGSDTLLASYDPTFVFSCYDLRRTAAQPQLGCAGFWIARGFELVTMYIPGLVERGEYYTFLAKKARDFQCPGRVH
jgi:arabinofuranosyltransferase